MGNGNNIATTTPCTHCGGEGMVGGCPSCMKIKQILRVESTKKLEIEKASIKSELKSFFDANTLKVSKGRLDEPKFNSYVDGCMKLVNSASIGKVFQKSILVVSPSRYGKTILQKTIQYNYLSSGIPVHKIHTFEEVMNKLHRVCDGRSDEILFAEEKSLLILRVILPNGSKTKNDLRLFYTMMEQYSRPSIVFISTNEVNSVLPNIDENSKSALKYKTPEIIYFSERSEVTNDNTGKE